MMTALVTTSPTMNWDQKIQILANSLAGVDEWDEIAMHLSKNGLGKGKYPTLIAQSLQRLDGDRRELSPDELFVAHWYVANWLMTLDFRKSLAPMVVDLVICDWLRVCNDQRFLLRSPAQLVPEIQQACRAQGSPMARMAKILIAASTAVRIQLPPGAIDILKSINKE